MCSTYSDVYIRITYLYNFSQGFQFVVDDSGGFSAVAENILENIADEYGNTPVFLYTVRGPDSYIKPGNQNQKMLRGLHDAISFSRLSTFCKLVVPVGLPSLSTSKLHVLHIFISTYLLNLFPHKFLVPQIIR